MTSRWPATVTPACSTAAAVETRARALLGLHRLGDPAAVDEPSDVVRLLDAIDAELSGSADVALRAEVMAARSQSRAHLLADDRSSAVSMAAEALELARSAGTNTPSPPACSPTTTRSGSRAPRSTDEHSPANWP